MSTGAETDVRGEFVFVRLVALRVVGVWIFEDGLHAVSKRRRGGADVTFWNGVFLPVGGFYVEGHLRLSQEHDQRRVHSQRFLHGKV